MVKFNDIGNESNGIPYFEIGDRSEWIGKLLLINALDDKKPLRFFDIMDFYL